jgi:hypothetical protein
MLCLSRKDPHSFLHRANGKCSCVQWVYWLLDNGQTDCYAGRILYKLSGSIDCRIIALGTLGHHAARTNVFEIPIIQYWHSESHNTKTHNSPTKLSDECYGHWKASAPFGLDRGRMNRKRPEVRIVPSPPSVDYGKRCARS